MHLIFNVINRRVNRLCSPEHAYDFRKITNICFAFGSFGMHKGRICNRFIFCCFRKCRDNLRRVFSIQQNYIGYFRNIRYCCHII